MVSVVQMVHAFLDKTERIGIDGCLSSRVCLAEKWLIGMTLFTLVPRSRAVSFKDQDALMRVLREHKDTSIFMNLDLAFVNPRLGMRVWHFLLAE